MKWIVALAFAAALSTGAAPAQDSAPPAYAPDGKMLFPAGYRTWVFLSSGFDMSYVAAPDRPHLFDNVFVNRESYDTFVKTGAWPDRTVLVLELRAPGSNDPVVKRGQFQSGPPINVEAHVKDAAKGGWSFYAFGTGNAPAVRLPQAATCYSCHAEHAATDTTFTQFYPALPAAK
jgi:Cytochrome P460